MARRRRVSAAVSESEEEGSSPMEGERGAASSSEPEPDMESSSRVGGGGLVVRNLVFDEGWIEVRRLEAGPAEEDIFLFFWEAGVVKKEDIIGN